MTSVDLPQILVKKLQPYAALQGLFSSSNEQCTGHDRKIITNRVSSILNLFDGVMNACQKIYRFLNDDDIDRDGAEEAVDDIKVSSPNKSVKIALKITSSMLLELVNNHKSNNQTQGEARLIIDNIRPFINRCIISQLEGVKYEW